MTTPTLPLATTQVIIDWITAAGWDTRQELGWPLYPGPEILDEPDQAVFITPIATGPGFITEEGAVDGWGFQARVRGASDDPLGPESAAMTLDRLIGFTAPRGGGATADGVRVAAAYRTGGPPSPLPLDPSSRRFEYTCSYVIVRST